MLNGGHHLDSFNTDGTGHDMYLNYYAQKPVFCGTVVFATQYLTYPDATMLDVQDVDPILCSDIVSLVNPKTYKTNEDVIDSYKVGFVVEDLEYSLDDKMLNILADTEITQQDEDGEDIQVNMRTLNYGRLTTILWGACQDLLARVEMLEANL